MLSSLLNDQLANSLVGARELAVVTQTGEMIDITADVHEVNIAGIMF